MRPRWTTAGVRLISSPQGAFPCVPTNPRAPPYITVERRAASKCTGPSDASVLRLRRPCSADGRRGQRLSAQPALRCLIASVVIVDYGRVDADLAALAALALDNAVARRSEEPMVAAGGLGCWLSFHN